MFSHLRKWRRIIYIWYILNKYNVVEVVATIPLLKVLHLTLYINPFYWFRNRNLTRGERLRLCFEQLGPIFIKFGQALSTRKDLLPFDIAEELAKLQDQVPPFSGAEATALIEKSLGGKVETLFATFATEPLASASIAQVHQAELLNGKKVVVKVLRPHIEKILRQDTALLAIFAKWIEHYVPNTRRLRPVDVVHEISRDLLDELDLMREAANASQLKRNFKDSNIHYVPDVYWDYCRSNVLTLEEIEGIPVADIKRLNALGVDMKLLAERGVEIFYTQVFRDCFFHADMHPGNIFVDATNPLNPKYISIDFGIVGTLTREDQQYLAGNFLAFFNRDYKKVAELHIESGWVPAHTRVDELESAIRTVCEPIFEKPLADISFGYTLMRLFQVARRFEMQVQPQLVLLQKTLLNIEGLGRQLYPQLNLWSTAKPFLEKWMKQQLGLKGFLKRSYEHLPRMSEKLPEVPDILFDILQATQNQIKKSKSIDQSQAFENKPTPQRHRGFGLGIGLSLIVVGAVLSFDQPTLSSIRQIMFDHSQAILIAGGALTLFAWFKK